MSICVFVGVVVGVFVCFWISAETEIIQMTFTVLSLIVSENADHP